MKELYTLLLFFILGTNICSAQQVIGSVLNEKQFAASINLVDDFIARFNSEKDSPILNKKDKDYLWKEKIILFNGKKFKTFKDSLFAEARSFVDTTIITNTKLHFSDSTWFAKAKCHGKFKGKDVSFYLYLTVENRKEQMYKWVIAKAEGELFRLKPSQKNDKIMLMPDDHETYFMSLNRITKEKDDYITNYAKKTCFVDETTSFFTLVYYGFLDIEYITDLEFMFLQVPGYIFSIRYFERETANSGWLIDSFHKCTDKNKTKLLNFIHKK